MRVYSNEDNCMKFNRMHPLFTLNAVVSVCFVLQLYIYKAISKISNFTQCILDLCICNRTCNGSE